MNGTFVIREESHLPGIWGVYLSVDSPRIASADSEYLAANIADSLNRVLAMYAESHISVTVDA